MLQWIWKIRSHSKHGVNGEHYSRLLRLTVDAEGSKAVDDEALTAFYRGDIPIIFVSAEMMRFVKEDNVDIGFHAYVSLAQAPR